MDSHHLAHRSASAEARGAGVDRRRFVMLGGATVAGTALIAACKGATPPVSVAPASTTTTMLLGSSKDLAILNTAISIEAVAQSMYNTILGGTLVSTASTLDLLKLFQSQHAQHQDLLTRTVRGAGGTPVTQANPVIMAQVVQPQLTKLASESDVVNLAYTVEHLLASTCQASIGALDHPTLNTTMAQIGGNEARHVALWAIVSNKSAMGTPDGPFGVDSDAVSPGIGI
ncbi:MAG TPA: ferritin-like domain-containing protein [Acidimicrobiales bacterium]|jgi:hypothetical protein|nr:ferritin-like domain-containing protein [Acidimicrobiales bacterium]